MRDVPAIVVPAVDLDQLTRSILRDHVAYQDGERQLETAERKTESLRETQARRRVEIGRQLVEAKRAVRHGQWLAYLEKLGIEARRAQEWMSLAGWVEKNATSENAAHLPAPTLADAGIDKRPRKSDAPDVLRSRGGGFALGLNWQDTTPRSEKASTLDIDRELLAINQKVMAHARGWSQPARQALAHELRSMAELIEEMHDD